MYILVDEPTGSRLNEAFSALDDAFGTGEFDKKQALSALANSLELSEPEANSLLSQLERGGHITDTLSPLMD